LKDKIERLRRLLARATVYHATGRRIRDLPITPAKLLA
jgi:CO/xanthine dehydrogenase Mo-binding subunit